MTDVLLCVGNCMMGDDGAGPLLAELCAGNPPRRLDSD
ncbi:Hydrogenase 3 maturation protease [Serratia proteamaculans]|nr:Hydrogenase 3 maturation protease [Serratia proteamaculans]